MLLAGMMLACQNKNIAVTHWPEELVLILGILRFCTLWCNSQSSWSQVGWSTSQ